MQRALRHYAKGNASPPAGLQFQLGDLVKRNRAGFVRGDKRYSHSIVYLDIRGEDEIERIIATRSCTLPAITSHHEPMPMESLAAVHPRMGCAARSSAKEPTLF